MQVWKVLCLHVLLSNSLYPEIILSEEIDIKQNNACSCEEGSDTDTEACYASV